MSDRGATMSRKWMLVSLVVVLIGAGGCGSSAPSPTATTGATRSVTAQDRAVKFAECLRGHGVPHFPDPDAKGEFQFGVDVSPAVWTRAVDACRALEPPGAVSGRRSAGQQSTALRFAQCMRAKGVRDFPDPADGAPLIDTTQIPSSNRPGGMAILNATIAKCRSLLKLAAGGQG
jgi:hypothetical protein